MSAHRFWAVRCDRCGSRIVTDRVNVHHARAQAAAEGWTRPRHNPGRNQMRIDVCPDGANPGDQ